MSPVDLQEWFPSTYRFGKAFARMARGAGRGIAFLVRKTYKYTLGFFIVLAVAHGIFTIILGRRVEGEILAIKASGAPIAMTELGQPKVPDSENGAIIYAKVIEGMTGMVLNPKGGRPIKSGMRPKDLGFTIDRFVDSAERQKDPKLWDEARLIMPRYSRLLPLIEEAASKPECQFAVNWQDGAAALFPHFAAMRRMSKLLQANALLEARDGNMDEAVRSIELGFKVSRSLKDEPTMIGQLVRIFMLRISCRSLREILQYGSISEAQARRLDSTLAQPGMLPSLDRAMQGEGCFGLWAFGDLRRNPVGFWNFSGQGNAPSGAVARILGYIWRPFLYADEMVYLKIISGQIEVMRGPYREIHGRPELADPTAKMPRYAIMSLIVLPVFTGAIRSRDAGMAEIAGSRMLLGLQVYKDRYGYYPANLNALSQLGWEVPADPFSGKDFIYRPKANGFLLYSVGQNLKDDGAKPYGLQPVAAPHGSPTGQAPGAGSPGQEGYRYKNMKGDLVADIVWEMDH